MYIISNESWMVVVTSNGIGCIAIASYIICIGSISSASYSIHSKKILLTADSRNPWIRGFQQTSAISASSRNSSTTNPDCEKGGWRAYMKDSLPEGPLKWILQMPRWASASCDCPSSPKIPFKWILQMPRYPCDRDPCDLNSAVSEVVRTSTSRPFRPLGHIYQATTLWPVVKIQPFSVRRTPPLLMTRDFVIPMVMMKRDEAMREVVRA